jgi:MoxR-like ATPase
MPIDGKTGEEITCDILHDKISEKGIILDRDKQIEPICNALKIGKNMMFVGAPGTAKTVTAKALGEILNKKDSEGREEKVGMERISANRDMTAGDFFGDWKFPQMMLEAQQCKGDYQAGLTCKNFFTDEYFNDGPALKAVKGGKILFIDEINRAGADFPNMIFEMAEEKQVTIPSLNNGKPISNVDKRFPLIIGTMNELDTGTTREMSVALARRFAYIFFDTADGATLQKILEENYGKSVLEDGNRVVKKALDNYKASPKTKEVGE